MIKIETAIQKAFDREDYSIYKPRFNASSFPYCAREHFIYAYLPPKNRPLEGAGFYKDFFTNQGKVIHTAVQNALGRVGLLLGNWVCANIDCANNEVIEFATGTPMCKLCNKLMDYKEIALNRDLFGGMGGYIDGLLPDYDAILEIKTKSAAALARMSEPIYHEWAYQASAYSDAMDIQYQLKIENIIMLYINRDNPHIFQIFEKKARQGTLQEQLRLRAVGDECIKAKTLPRGICENMRMGKEEMRCLYAPICFSSSLENMLVL